MSLLLLLRHAKSGWATPGVRDFDRMLDDTGRSEAATMGQEMARRGLRPDFVLCSPSARTRQTLQMLGDLGGPRTLYPERLYSENAAAYLEEIRSAANAANMLVVGHNPMMEDVATLLTGGGDKQARQALAAGFPTAALAIIRFEAPLASVAPGAGRLEAFLRPQRA